MFLACYVDSYDVYRLILKAFKRATLSRKNSFYLTFIFTVVTLFVIIRVFMGVLVAFIYDNSRAIN